MGRAMLIIVTGLMVTMGYTFMGMSNQKASITSQNVSSANKAMAKNMAHTGIQFAINELKENSSWPENQTKSETIDGTTIEYSWVDYESDPNLIQITAKTTHNKTNTTDEIVTTIEKEPTIDLSMIPGAMGVYGENSQVTINGEPPSIDGRDYNMDETTPNGDTESYKAGAAGVNSEAETFTSTDEDLLTGDPDYNEDPDLDSQFLHDDLENKYLPNAETYDGSNLGTVDHPNIVTVEGTNDKVNANGSGILIVRPGAKLTLGGTYKYYGLIIVQGTLELKGTPQVYGSILFTDNSTVDVEDADGDVEDPDGTYAGTPDIRYSSQALTSVSQKLQTGGAGDLVSMYD